MIKFSEFIKESLQISMTKKAWGSLSRASQDAIQSWESSGWVGGPLEKSVKANDDIAKDIEKVFAPIRATLPQKVKLYRGLNHGIMGDAYKGDDKFLESWSSDKKVAMGFAGLYNDYYKKSMLLKPISDQEIEKALATFKKLGYVTWQNHKYILNKQHPQYYNIYDRSNQMVTDGEVKRMRDDMKSHQLDRSEHNERKNSAGTLLEEMIDRDRIIWITNNLNSKEYIVKKK